MQIHNGDNVRHTGPESNDHLGTNCFVQRNTSKRGARRLRVKSRLLAPTPNRPSLCRFPVTHSNHLEPVGGLGIAAGKGRSVKSRRPGQICVGANTLTRYRSLPPGWTPQFRSCFRPKPDFSGRSLFLEVIGCLLPEKYFFRGSEVPVKLVDTLAATPPIDAHL